MRLISCQISGFGKLVGVSYDLSAPLVCIKQENGFGKTTLADFICCMFYGLDGSRVRAVSENERVKYEPWSGARFGGALTFSYQEKIYRIERFFGKTPSADSVKLYDENNMLCYDFGEKCQRLGETLFKMDRDSFLRTAYIKQGSAKTSAIGESLRARLLALLSAESDREGGVDAVAKLDTAERALRAKRRPAKGKLDEIDEKLAYLQTQKAQCLRAEESARGLQEQCERYSQNLQAVKTEIEKTNALVEEYTRKSELSALRATQKEILERREEAKNNLARLTEFFGLATPSTVNTAGLEGAIDEFYALKEEIETLYPSVDKIEKDAQEKQTLLARLSASEKALESYELMREEIRQESKADKRGKKTDERAQKKEEKKARRRHFRAGVTLPFCLLLILLGAILINTSQTFAICLLILGGVGLSISGWLFLKTASSAQKDDTMYEMKNDFPNERVRENYLLALSEKEKVEELLARFSSTLEEDAQTAKAQIREKEDRKQALKNAIEKFLSNFRFDAIYDYRVALTQIKDNAREHAQFTAVCDECSRKLNELNLPVYPQNDEKNSDMRDGEEGTITSEKVNEIYAKKERLEREKDELSSLLISTRTQAESYQTHASELAEIKEEEARLEEEKTRLERRLLAVRTARELILRARHNLSARYLQSVEKTVEKYAKAIGVCINTFPKFNAEGAPLLEESTSLKNVEYYSAGMQDQLWLCIRLALIEALQINPPLLLDDPFINFDDERTEKAKALLGEICKKYQIIYFTCKEERVINARKK